MKAKKLLTWLFVLMSIALLVVGFFLLKNAKWNSDGVQARITLVQDGEEKRVTGNTVEMKNLTLLAPGELYSESYSIKIKLEDDGNYTFTLDFSETKDGGLKKFVDVMVKQGDKVLKQTTLEKLLGGSEKVKFEKEVASNGTVTLDLIYTMRETYVDGDEIKEVTDEIAGKTYASFNIKLAIKE